MESGVLRTRARRAGKRHLAVISAAPQSWPFALGRAGFSHHEGAVYRSTDLTGGTGAESVLTPSLL